MKGGLNSLPHNYDFQRPCIKKPFENVVEKGENAGNQHFLLFPQCFLPFPKQISIFQSHLSPANTFSLNQSEILSFGKELIHLQWEKKPIRVSL